mmetsp:Transcript_4548/g.12437  ORF Transcript_4548/g.12437 Transcript_4548/m.12437 type:complete len:91 (-) Transcript_4548:1313-1585(-)
MEILSSAISGSLVIVEKVLPSTPIIQPLLRSTAKETQSGHKRDKLNSIQSLGTRRDLNFFSEARPGALISGGWDVSGLSLQTSQLGILMS